MSALVFLNGQYIPRHQASVSIEDRGLLFGDGVYEVYRNYRGRPFKFKEHLDRLTRSLHELQMEVPAVDWVAVHGELLQRNGLAQADSQVYIQITRGAAVRTHHFPAPGTAPTVFASIRPLVMQPAFLHAEGAAAVLVPDERWGRCDIKSINLLANVLAKQKAVQAGAHEALLVRDGAITEGSSTNVFGVVDGQVVTHPTGTRILSGVTRNVTIQLARDLGFKLAERPVLVADLNRATELFMTSTSSEVMPVVRVDGRPIGDGRPGPVTLALAQALERIT